MTTDEISLRFCSPADGECIPLGEPLLVRVQGPSGGPVELCGRPARETAPGFFEAEVPLLPGWNRLTARHPRCSGEAWVFGRKGGKGFRLSVDDNILFLDDLNRSCYHSLFENPYLAQFKVLHRETGVPVQLNLFYETGDLSAFSLPRPYFNLSMMTDRFREEWRQNAHWLKLSFHSRKEFPPNPYARPGEEVAGDCRLVQREICRFAGEETLSRGATIHYCRCTQENLAALEREGVRFLCGFTGEEGQELRYCYPSETGRLTARSHFWADRERGLVCGRIDEILNTIPSHELASRLDRAVARGEGSGYLEFMIHEQYFYPDYQGYLPDFEERLFGACLRAKGRGFTGCWCGDFLEGVFENFPRKGPPPASGELAGE